jgi:hypothetical protein
MPVFEGLLPPICDVAAQDLIFIFTEWHGLAKLLLHTLATLKIMKTLTSKLGSTLREFARLTERLDVRETPKEYARRRKQCESKKKSTITKTTRAKARKSKASETPAEDGVVSDGRRSCTLNLDMYKMHALGDYVGTIEDYGTTDSFSTQIVCILTAFHYISNF